MVFSFIYVHEGVGSKKSQGMGVLY